MKWFTANNSEELRNQYKKLLIRYHPDNNSGTDTTAIMQEINAEYDTLLKQFAAIHADFKFSEKKESELKEVLSEVIKLKADILIELIGTWIWISGNTYSVKDRLKDLGFRWTKKKHKWYWGESTHRCAAYLTMKDLRAKYGSIVYRAQQDERVGIN